MKMFGILGIVVVAVLEVIGAAPTSDSDDSSFKFPIFFENGKVGVNFLGFHASAGLGGLITGNDADGGLQAEAGTPFGQKAYAGLGGRVNGAGRSAGGLYAGATAGGGVGAKAGLGGETGSDGSFGTSYAGASAGGLYKGKVKAIGQPAIATTANLNVRKEYIAPVDSSNIQVITKKEKIKKIDTSVIAPDVQEIDVPSPVFNLDVSAKAIAQPPPPPPLPQFPVYVEKRKYKLRRRPHHRKQVIITNEFIPTPLETPVFRYNEGVVGGPATVIVKKKIVNGGVNVPISTLNEAEQLVGSFSRRVEEAPIKPVEVEAVASVHKNSNVGFSKSLTVKAEASKPVTLLNFEASKHISINS